MNAATTTRASDALWSASESLGVVPGVLSTNTAMGRAVDRWQSTPRARGCRHADATTAVLPDPALYCLRCARSRAGGAPCALCDRTPAPNELVAAVWAEVGPLLYLAKFCPNCQDTDTNRSR